MCPRYSLWYLLQGVILGNTIIYAVFGTLLSFTHSFLSSSECSDLDSWILYLCVIVFLCLPVFYFYVEVPDPFKFSRKKILVGLLICYHVGMMILQIGLTVQAGYLLWQTEDCSQIITQSELILYCAFCSSIGIWLGGLIFGCVHRCQRLWSPTYQRRYTEPVVMNV